MTIAHDPSGPGQPGPDAAESVPVGQPEPHAAASVPVGQPEPHAAASVPFGQPGPDAAPFTWRRQVEPIFNRDTFRRLRWRLIALLAGVVAFIVVCFAISAILGLIAFALAITLGIISPIAIWWQSIAEGSLNDTVFTLDPRGAASVREAARTRASDAAAGAIEVGSMLGTYDGAPLGRGAVRPREVRHAIWWREVDAASFDEQRHVVHLHGRRGEVVHLYATAREWPAVHAWVAWGVGVGGR